MKKTGSAAECKKEINPAALRPEEEIEEEILETPSEEGGRSAEGIHTFAVCAYKESPWLEACLFSLREQTVKSDVIMITSTPNDHIRSIAEKYGVPLLVNTGGGGITQDWNFAYTHAATRYVTITHQDDLYEPEYAQRAVQMLERSRKPLIFFCDYYEIRNDMPVLENRLLNVKRMMLLPIRLPFAQRSRWIRRRILSFGSPICCPSVTFAKENLPYAVFRHGFRACEDWEAWEMISKRKGDFLYCPEPLMGHRIHEDSETSAIIGDNLRSEEEYIMFRKFWPAPAARLLNRKYASAQKSNRL
ncbi:MAG: glycosyltransferase [Eubacteriales bacterium]|nr:glycosyltransferase [Eubacteriales bacterium]